MPGLRAAEGERGRKECGRTLFYMYMDEGISLG